MYESLSFNNHQFFFAILVSFVLMLTVVTSFENFKADHIVYMINHLRYIYIHPQQKLLYKYLKRYGLECS